MNMTLIGQMVKKDWELNQWPMIAYLILGMVALWLIITPGAIFFAVGSILLITVVITIGIHMVISTVTNERKNQTLTFMMSLPMSYREYTMAKMIANIGVTGGAWVFLYGILAALILLLEPFPDGIFPFATLTMMYLFMIYIVLLATSMISESEPVTIVVMTVMNMTISLFMIWMGNHEGIGHLNGGAVAIWTPAAVTAFVSIISVIVVALAITFYMQSKKRNFL